MARLRYNGLATGSAGATTPLAVAGTGLTNSATSVTFNAALTHSNGTAVPTITGSDYIPLSILDSNGHVSEIVWLTAYTSGATTGTIARGKEGTAGVTHSSGDKVICSPLASDISTPYLDLPKLDATYGDDFTGSSLDAKWTRVGYVSGDEQYQMGGGTWLQIDTPRGSNNYYYQTAPSGDFTVVMKATLVKPISVMFGPLILDSSGNGVSAITYDNPDAVSVVSVTTGAYGNTSQGASGLIHTVASTGLPIWYRLNKTGTAYKASVSTNGAIWRAWTPTITFATTPTRIGFGGIFGTAFQFAVDWFDVK